jgi:hypothetical protein
MKLLTIFRLNSIKMAKLNKPHWVVQMDWLDKETYWSLDESIRKDLTAFQNISKAIKLHDKKIKANLNAIRGLENENRVRAEKIRLHKLNATPLFRKVEFLKAEHEIDVYYLETMKKGKVRDKDENGQFNKNWIPTEYPKCYIKFRTKNLDNIRTIVLKSQRFENLNILKKVCPKWYGNIGEELKSEKLNSNKVKIAMVELFKPTIKRILANQFKEIEEGKVVLNFDLVLAEMSKMKL